VRNFLIQQKFSQIGENMAQFINTKENIVTEAIDGLVAASGGKLARLDGYPHMRVVVRNDWDKSKVALISGADRATNRHMRVSSGKGC
jgi:dihydroxyacetone kinase